MLPSIQQPSAGLGTAGDPLSTDAQTITPSPRAFQLEMKRAMAGTSGQANQGQSNAAPGSTPGPNLPDAEADLPGQKTPDSHSSEPTRHSSQSRRDLSLGAPVDPVPTGISQIDPLQLLATTVVPLIPIATATNSPSPQFVPAAPVGQGIPATGMRPTRPEAWGGPVPQSKSDREVSTRTPQSIPSKESAIEKRIATPAEQSLLSVRPTTSPGTPAVEASSNTTGPEPTKGDVSAVLSNDPNRKMSESSVQAEPGPPQANAHPPVADMARRIPAAPTISSPANPSVEPKAGSPLTESSQPLGTSAAQQEPSMKKAENGPKTAELAQQNLPSSSAVTAAHEEPRPTTESQPSVSALTSSSSADNARQLSLERTHDLVTTHSLRLTQSGNDSMRVVIEPGSGTRLSLELRLNNGAVEVQAQLHRGDFEFLSHHWTELQQRLEPRGVHLAALENPADSSTGQPNSEQRGRQPAEEQPTRSAFAEFAFDDSMVDSPAKRRGRAKKYAGWESWA